MFCMFRKNKISIDKPKPYEIVEIKFCISGKISKSWLLYDKYGLSVDWMDINGNDLQAMSPLVNIAPEYFFRFGKKVKFYSSVDLGCFKVPENPRGLIIEIGVKIGGKDNHFLLLPLVVKGTGQVSDADCKSLKKKLSDGVNKVVQYKKDWDNYLKEIESARDGIACDGGIAEEIFKILNESEEAFEAFSESDEEKKEKEIEEKYKNVIKWKGPLFRGIVGRMDGFSFVVYSGDHQNPEHFHVLHKGRGINAYFSFPQIELLKYKNYSNTIGSKEIKKIQDYFKIEKNFQELNGKIQKLVS